MIVIIFSWNKNLKKIKSSIHNIISRNTYFYYICVFLQAIFQTFVYRHGLEKHDSLNKYLLSYDYYKGHNTYNIL